MNYVIASFKSRAATLNFANLLKKNNVPCAIINTPNSIGKSCGISVKFLSDYFSKVQTLMTVGIRATFSGFYSLSNVGGRDKIFKL